MRPVFISVTTLLASVVLFGLAGCGGPPARATVKGQVKLGEKNLTSGTVFFTAIKDNSTGSATIDGDGNYVMRDAPLGEVKIAITVSKGMGGGKAMMKPPTGTGMPADQGKAGPGAIDFSKIVPIPDKYGSAETSQLTYTVSSGTQTHNINLTP